MNYKQLFAIALLMPVALINADHREELMAKLEAIKMRALERIERSTMLEEHERQMCKAGLEMCTVISQEEVEAFEKLTPREQELYLEAREYSCTISCRVCEEMAPYKSVLTKMQKLCAEVRLSADSSCADSSCCESQPQE
jgi:hypothetical protein